MKNGFLLAAAPELLSAFDLTDRVDLVLYAGYLGYERIAKARAAIAKASGRTCNHNEMVAHDEPGHAWKCALCGHVYGKENRDEEGH